MLKEMLGDPTAWTEVSATVRPLTQDPRAATRIAQVDLLLPAAAQYPMPCAGQHVTIQGLIGGRWVSRTYTVINPGATNGVIRIAVRRVPRGQFSPWLLDDVDAPKRLRVSVPLGEPYWQASQRHTVCFVGGIGITVAMSLLAQLPASVRFHLDYSARSKSDQVFSDELQTLCEQNTSLSVQCRTDDVDGSPIKDVDATAARFFTAKYVLCGPPAYVKNVHDALLKTGVPSHNIHIEKFFIAQTQRPQARGWKWYGYRIGAVAALLPSLWLLPTLQASVPHHQPTVGHEKLECVDCHKSAPGTLRQQLQAKVDHLRGRRELPAAFVYEPVTNRVCEGCHQRADDRHPPHRFMEPRFQDVRASLAPQHCVSCHREHENLRVTLPDTQFCAACHKELNVKQDRVTPTHAELIRDGRWESCLGCHDFHNNHAWKEPERLSDAIAPERIRDYFSSGGSPYGDVKEKAKAPLAYPTPTTP